MAGEALNIAIVNHTHLTKVLVPVKGNVLYMSSVQLNNSTNCDLENDKGGLCVLQMCSSLKISCIKV